MSANEWSKVILIGFKKISGALIAMSAAFSATYSFLLQPMLSLLQVSLLQLKTTPQLMESSRYIPSTTSMNIVVF